MIKNLMMFIRSLLRHWVPLITGSIAVAAVGIYEHNSASSLAWSKYVYIVEISIFVSCFLAWRTEHVRRSSLEEAIRPRLKHIYMGSHERPEYQVHYFPDQNDSNLLEQSQYRFGIYNDSKGDVIGAKVVLDRVESALTDSFYPGHCLRVMGSQGHSPSFKLGPNATQWIDIVSKYKRMDDESCCITYAEIGDVEIPPGCHQLLLRADGGGSPYFLRAEITFTMGSPIRIAIQAVG